MSTYIVGDVHGRLAPLRRLLDLTSTEDRFLFVGDLVNVGPDSLGVVDQVRALGDRAEVVLGNHDLHFLAVALGAAKMRTSDTFDDLLNASELTTHVDWLLHRRLLIRHGEAVVVHAGIHPLWPVEDAASMAHTLEQRLQTGPEAFFRQMYGNAPELARPKENGLDVADLQRFAVNMFTRMRTLFRDDLRLEFEWKGEPRDIPAHLIAWFDVERAGEETIYFGHWSALGFRELPGAVALDAGCAWGRCLAARRLDDGATILVPVDGSQIETIEPP